MFATVPPPRRRLLVFARLPEHGAVKTRLAAQIGADRALAIYEAMLRDVVNAVGTSSSELEIEFMWTAVGDADGGLLRRTFAPHAVAMQTGRHLGDRISMAFSERFFFHRTETIVAIGVDDPSISRELVDHAFELLESCEWVVGPALDGGYYLIGCRAGAFDAEVFIDIDWGSGRVLAQTLEKIRVTERSVAVLPPRYDIDTLEDLRRYAFENHPGSLGALLRAESEMR